MSGLRETLIEGLKDIYDAEKQLVKALPKMVKAAQNEEFKAALESHLEETENQVQRLEQVFELLDETPKAKKCKAMQGLLEEAQELIKEEAGDAALICAGQKVEHYEIATYGSLRAWAELLEESDAADLFQETLDEEKEADEKLTEIAETAANPEAESEDEAESADETSDEPVTRGKKR